MTAEDKPISIKDRIIQYMNQTLLSTLVTVVEGRPVSRMMLFGNDNTGTLWVCVRADSSILDEVRRLPFVALSIFREEVLLENIASLSVEGLAKIIDEPLSDASLMGYDILGRKSPRLGDIPHAGKAKAHRIIKISPHVFRFHTYYDHIQGKPAVTLKRKTGDATI
jgi:hypothetical protein